MANIAVFCGAREVASTYAEEAYLFGETLAKKGHKLIYGGGTNGIMGAIYRGASTVGGVILGVIPQFLVAKEGLNTLETMGTEFIKVDTMDERKKIIFDNSDVIIMLPGGVGTLDEFFEAITLLQLKQRTHKLGVLNSKNFYDSLILQLDMMEQEGFLEDEIRKSITITSNIDELFHTMSL